MSLRHRLLPTLVILLFLPGVPGATSTTAVAPSTDSRPVAGEHHVD